MNYRDDSLRSDDSCGHTDRIDIRMSIFGKCGEVWTKITNVNGRLLYNIDGYFLIDLVKCETGFSLK